MVEGMNVRRLVTRSISEISALASCARPPVEGLRVLMYHAIGTPALDDRLGLYSLSVERFRRQMIFLSNWHHGKVVDLTKSELAKKGCRVAITFDDGYLDNLEVAAPILTELGLPFTVFVASEFVRTSKSGFLTPAALRMLAALPGVQIGAHGANHVALSECDDQALKTELRVSRECLEDIVGYQIKALSYPFGAANQRVKNAVLEAGYDLGACSMAGINRPERDPLLLTRTDVVSYDDMRTFLQKLHGDWDWYRYRTKDPACL
jgi:peptidoglycan/xylan/chitin deacetylase (PgdA/CDA1 family)